MRVNIIIGTTDMKCRCSGGWIKHWQRYGDGEVVKSCSVVGCSGTPVVGAHVQEDGVSEKNCYVIPLCTAHNAKTGTLIIQDIDLSATNVNKTCGKSG